MRMLWTRRATDAALFGVMLALALTSALVAGCGSAGRPRHTLPEDERGLLELTPNDAFMGARLDLRAARAMPHWAELETWLTKYSGEDWSEWLDGTDRVVLLVGGLVTAPSFPEVDPDAEQAPAPPAWVPLARAFGGALPRAVLVVEGSAAELCRAALEGHSGREVRGYRVGVTNGLALLVRERECLLTYEPVVDSLLNQPPGPPSPIAGQLAGRTDEGAPSIFRYAIQHDDPGFVALIEQGSVGADREVERQRELRREREASLAEGGESGEQSSAFLMSMMMNIELFTAQLAKFRWELGEIALHGLTESEGYLVHEEGSGYTVRQRVRFDHAARAAMSGEVVRVALQLFERTVTTFDIPEPGREVRLSIVRGVEVTDRPDGYDLRAAWSDSVVNAVVALANQPDEEWLPREDEADDSAGQVSVYDEWNRAVSAPIAESLPMLEALQQRLAEDPAHHFRFLVRTSLASAYSFFGRYDDAVAFLRAEIDREVANGNDTPEASWAMCHTAAELCEVHLRQGFARQAEEASTIAIQGGSTCAEANYVAFACQQVARAQQGAVDSALEAAEARVPRDEEDEEYFDTLLFAMLRIRILQAGGRDDDANQVLQATCPRPILGEWCLDWFDVELGVTASVGSSLERWDAQLLDARAAYPGGPTLNMFDNRVAAALKVADCTRRARLAPRDAATLAACEAAQAFVDGQHGPTHVSAAEVRIPLLAVYRAQRRAADATRVSDELVALRTRLGPQHPANATTGSRPARPGPR